MISICTPKNIRFNKLNAKKLSQVIITTCDSFFIFFLKRKGYVFTGWSVKSVFYARRFKHTL